jgi:hypothetical protein
MSKPTGIRVIAQKAYAAGQNMIGVAMGQPAVYWGIVPSIDKAREVIAELLAQHDSIVVHTDVRYTRAPKGYHAIKHELYRDNVRAGK